VIFCGNRDQNTEKDESLISSLFSLTSDELFNSSTLSSSSLLFIAETLAVRESRVDWSEFLQREMIDRGF